MSITNFKIKFERSFFLIGKNKNGFSTTKYFLNFISKLSTQLAPRFLLADYARTIVRNISQMFQLGDNHKFPNQNLVSYFRFRKYF